MVNGWYVERHGGENHTYAAIVGFEELLEMVGRSPSSGRSSSTSTRRPVVQLDPHCAVPPPSSSPAVDDRAPF